MTWDGVDLLVAGTGYTGEDGIEIAVPAADAPRLWDAVLASGVAPAGLGARDTLRLEAALPLHGHELGPGITPLQAGLGWVVAWDKGEFRGRAALEDERAARRCPPPAGPGGRGPPAAARRAGRAHRRTIAAGVITSGNFSPTLGHGIALAFLPPDVEEGAEVSIDVRGEQVPAQVVPTPFVRRGEVAPATPDSGGTDMAGRRIWRALLAVIAAFSLVAACGGDDGDDEATDAL